jgi:hypothetical protein
LSHALNTGRLWVNLSVPFPELTIEMNAYAQP